MKLKIGEVEIPAEYLERVATSTQGYVSFRGKVLESEPHDFIGELKTLSRQPHEQIRVKGSDIEGMSIKGPRFFQQFMTRKEKKAIMFEGRLTPFESDLEE